MIDNLITKIIEKKNPTLMGLDTRLEYLPNSLIKQYCGDKMTLEDAAQAILEFNKQIINKVYEFIPGVKVQVAYYEMYGLAGIDAFIATCKYAKSKGLLV